MDTPTCTDDHRDSGAVSQSVFNDERRPGARPAFSPADRAFAMAELHRSRNGALPTVRELAGLAEVSIGTAQTALRQIRQAPPALHLVDGDTNSEPSA